MIETTRRARYLALRRESRDALSVTRKWTTVPALLDELDALRQEQRLRSESWVDRFAQALEVGRAVEAERARDAARALWPWIGAYEPEAVARGQWDLLPRSYA